MSSQSFSMLQLLSQAVVLSCFKATTIKPVAKKPSPSTFNDCRPIALTPLIINCFERQVMAQIKSTLPTSLDPYQSAYRGNRSTEDAISSAVHPALTHLDTKNSHVRMLFIDFSSAFNTFIPQPLIGKLDQLGLSTSLCHWLLDFLSERPHGSAGRQQHIQSLAPPRLCAQPPALDGADPRLHSFLQRQPHCEVRG